MKRCLFIINPTSGQRTIQQKLDSIIGKLVLEQTIHTVDIFYTKGQKEAYQKAYDVPENQYDFFVAVGGDGTINEVISGMVDSKKTIPLAILSAGTVNDFATHLALPTNVNKICQMITNFKTITSDVGKINDRYFINVAAGGMFSDISFVVSKDDKKRLGPFAYYVSGMMNLPSQLQTNMQLSISIDHQPSFDVDALLFMVTNTNRVGGFNKIAPYADIQDGLLDVMIIKKCSATDLVSLYKDYLLKKHVNSPFLIYQQAKTLTVTCHNQEVVIDVDGEKGASLPITIENIKGAITLLVP